MTNLIIRAAVLASNMHEGQKRKYTNRPYIEHPGRVAARISRLGCPKAMVAAAWLHDVMEDCDVSMNVRRHVYSMPLDVCLLVRALTNPSKQHLNLNRGARKEMDRNHIKNCPAQVRTIKLADRADNLRELDPSDTFASLYLAESKDLLLALCNTHVELEGELRAEIATLEKAIERAKAPPVLSATEAAVAAVLKEKMGGGPELLNDNNADHYHIVTDMLPFFHLAGPAWKAVADRVLAHQKNKMAKKSS